MVAACAIDVGGDRGSLRLPASASQYSSHATVMVGAGTSDPNPNSESYLAQQLVNTYVDLAQRDSVREPAMAALGLTWLPAYTVRQVPATQIMELKVMDTDPVRAQAVAQALIDQLIALSPSGHRATGATQFIEDELDLHSRRSKRPRPRSRSGRTSCSRCSAPGRLPTPRRRSALQAKLTSMQGNFYQDAGDDAKGRVSTT